MLLAHVQLHLQVIQQHSNGEQTIQDVLTQQEPSPDGEHTNWLELIQDFLVQHINLPGHGSVQELELDQDSTQILKEVLNYVKFYVIDEIKNNQIR